LTVLHTWNVAWSGKRSLLRHASSPSMREIISKAKSVLES
jgi:hypothetical protein